MAWMAGVLSLIGLVDAWALCEVVESLLIDPFVDIEVANQAFQVPCCLCKLVFAWCGLLWLVVQQDFDLLRPCEFSG